MKKRYWIAGAFGLAGAAVAVKLFCRPRDVVWVDHAHELHHAEHSRFAVVDGVRVHYQEAGAIDAPPMLLIHGFTASNFVWSDVLLPIAESGFRVIAPDLIGFGFSEKPKDGEYTIEAQARMITGLMDHLGIESAILVGNSYGGAVAATCALDYAERVERLVLVDAVTNDHVKSQLLLRLAASPVLGDLISPLMIGSHKLVFWRMKKGYAPENAHLFDENRMKAHHRPLLAASTQRAALTTLRRWRAERIEEEAESIKQPTLLIWGEDDPDIPLEHGRKAFERIPNSRLIIFRRCGHMPMEEYPREFVEVLTGYCRNAEIESFNYVVIDSFVPITT
ncbi:MAG TPA: alpha/beta hydrolase [Pyrinomonadaceae bacterium]|nr:alpha/beta hydrolase [Pyrinomonadaceae bacterium]